MYSWDRFCETFARFLKLARRHLALKLRRHNFRMTGDTETDPSLRIRLCWHFDSNRAGLVLAERTHVDDEPVPDVLAQHAFVGFVDLSDGNMTSTPETPFRRCIYKSWLEPQFKGKLADPRIFRRWRLAKFRRVEVSSGLRSPLELGVVEHIEELRAEL
jgi:hypothetical protein